MTPRLLWRAIRADRWVSAFASKLVTVKRGRHGGWRWQWGRRWGVERTPDQAKHRVEGVSVVPWHAAQQVERRAAA